MEALAEAKLIHRDLATRNVLVLKYDASNPNETSVKITDFGLTVTVYTAGYKCVEGGPLPTRWLAPEAIRKGRYSEKSDVWAFGVLCWEVATNIDIPYFEKPDDESVSAHVMGGGRLPRCALRDTVAAQ